MFTHIIRTYILFTFDITCIHIHIYIYTHYKYLHTKLHAYTATYTNRVWCGERDKAGVSVPNLGESQSTRWWSIKSRQKNEGNMKNIICILFCMICIYVRTDKIIKVIE